MRRPWILVLLVLGLIAPIVVGGVQHGTDRDKPSGPGTVRAYVPETRVPLTKAQIAAKILPDAVSPYTRSAFPKTFATWGAKGVKRIDTLRRQAAETIAAKHACNRVEIVDISDRAVPPNRPIVFVQCANGERFYLSEADVGTMNLRSEIAKAKELDPAKLEVQCFDAVQSILTFPSSFSRSWSAPRTELASSGNWVIEFDYSAMNGVGNTIPQTGRCTVTPEGRIEPTTFDR